MNVLTASCLSVIVLCIAGVTGPGCDALGIRKPWPGFFALCILSLNSFTLSFGSEFCINAGALAAALLPYAMRHERGIRETGTAALLLALVSAMCALLSVSLSMVPFELITGLSGGLMTLALREKPVKALATAAMLPLLSSALVAVTELAQFSYAAFTLTGDGLLQGQLIAVCLGFALLTAKKPRTANAAVRGR